MGSADSDDQLSVASDGSASSASRMMSVGEVQNLARLQEESTHSNNVICCIFDLLCFHHALPNIT